MAWLWALTNSLFTLLWMELTGKHFSVLLENGANCKNSNESVSWEQFLIFVVVLWTPGAVPVEDCPYQGQGVITAHLYGESRRVHAEFLNQSIP